jgi:hypothetical protein
LTLTWQQRREAVLKVLERWDITGTRAQLDRLSWDLVEAAVPEAKLRPVPAAAGVDQDDDVDVEDDGYVDGKAELHALPPVDNRPSRNHPSVGKPAPRRRETACVVCGRPKVDCGCRQVAEVRREQWMQARVSRLADQVAVRLQAGTDLDGMRCAGGCGVPIVAGDVLVATAGVWHAGCAGAGEVAADG